MPSSCLVEVEVEDEVGVEVGVEVFDLSMKSYHTLRVKSYFSGRVRWVGGWWEILGLKLISAQVVVEVIV